MEFPTNILLMLYFRNCSRIYGTSLTIEGIVGKTDADSAVAVVPYSNTTFFFRFLVRTTR